MLWVFLTPLGFSDARHAGEDALFPAELGVLGGLYFDIHSESGPDLGSPFLRGASYDSLAPKHRTEFIWAGDTVSIADSYFAHPLYLQSWLPAPALDPEASKAQLKFLSLVPGYQPPGYLPVKSTAGIVLVGSMSVRERCCTEGISSLALRKLVTAFSGLHPKEHWWKAKSESMSPGSRSHWLSENGRQP